MDSSFRSALLGTAATAFSGLEVGTTVILNGVIAKFTYTQILGNVPGMTQGVIAVSVGIQLGILRFTTPSGPAQSSQPKS